MTLLSDNIPDKHINSHIDLLESSPLTSVSELCLQAAHYEAAVGL